MADKPRDVGKGGKIRASLQKQEIQYIANKFGITGQAAAGAVRVAGPMREKVYAYIKVKKRSRTNASVDQRRRTTQSKGNGENGVHLYRTLHGWAIGTLLDTHAILECPEHGHIRDRGSWAHGWYDAKAIAKSHPFAGATAPECMGAIDEVMERIGDVCPEC